MDERWRKPVIPLRIEQQEDQGLWLPDGRVQGGVTFTLKPEDVERIRAGYVCAKCFEPFQKAWPVRCHVCGASIRRDQAAYFAREYGGHALEEPRPSVEEELEALPEIHAKEEERRKREQQRE